MSDSPPEDGGERWWQANDGKWYPPERHPDYTPPAGPPDPPASGGGSTPPAAAAENEAPVRVLTPETNGMAIAALVMAVLGYVLVGFGTLFAIVFALVALQQLRRADPPERGRGLATGALILSLLQVLLVVAVVTLVAAYLAMQAVGEEIDLQLDCRAERQALNDAAREYRADNGEYPTSQGQVRSYLNRTVWNYDYSDDGSGELTRLTGSDCPRPYASGAFVMVILLIAIVVVGIGLSRWKKRR